MLLLKDMDSTSDPPCLPPKWSPNNLLRSVLLSCVVLSKTNSKLLKTQTWLWLKKRKLKNLFLKHPKHFPNARARTASSRLTQTRYTDGAVVAAETRGKDSTVELARRSSSPVPPRLKNPKTR